MQILLATSGASHVDMAPTNIDLKSMAKIVPEKLDQLASHLSEPGATLKFGIDPTGAEVHLGHAVPIILADRLRRMGLTVDFIVGDITARIGDPSERSADRPPLTREDVAANLATYREQISPFFDFEKARFHFNSAWLEPVTLPDLLSLLARIPVSLTMQREDFC